MVFQHKIITFASYLAYCMDLNPDKNTIREQNTDSENPLFTAEIADDNCTWYALRLFTLRLKQVAQYFKDKGLTYFVPMEYADIVDPKEQKIRHVLRPVVRNLLFVKKDRDEQLLRKVIADAPFKLSVVRKSKDDNDFYEIPAKQMYEFQVMCNPEIEMRKYLREDEAKLKSGTPVLVTHGLLKGLTGKLVRSSKKYYLLKEVPGMAVMIKVSRWCCVPIEKQQSGKTE